MTHHCPQCDLLYCPQCDVDRRITEPYAFGGRDRLRSTLSCGHVVLRQAEEKTP